MFICPSRNGIPKKHIVLNMLLALYFICAKVNAFRKKRYYLYFIKQNRGKGIEWLMKHAMAPLNHMIDDHSLFFSSWCHKKRKEECTGVDTGTSERDNKGSYRCKVADRQLYDLMK